MMSVFMLLRETEVEVPGHGVTYPGYHVELYNNSSLNQ